jgi:hypothetical protein
VLAECDPAGRQVLAGYLTERLDRPAGPGLLGLAAAVGNDPAETAVGDYVIPLGGDSLGALLSGIRDPRQARHLTQLWKPLAETLKAEGDVIADLGRIGGTDTPWPLLTEADLVVMVMHRNLAQVDAAQPRLQALLEALNGRVPVVLCLVNNCPYSTAAIREALYRLPVIAELPYVPTDARVLSDGAPPRMTFRTCMLMRTVTLLGERMRTAVEHGTYPAVHPDVAMTLPPSFGGAP